MQNLSKKIILKVGERQANTEGLISTLVQSLLMPAVERQGDFRSMIFRNGTEERFF